MIKINNGEKDFTIEEKTLRRLVGEFMLGNMPRKQVLGRSPYGEGIIYQYHTEDMIQYLDASNRNLFTQDDEDFIWQLYMYGEYIGQDVIKLAYDMYDEELIKDYKSAALLFQFRNRKVLKVKYVLSDDSKRLYGIDKLELNKVAHGATT